jgi:DNA-binding transcriptional regulator YdaS (Cro superfamily)
MTAFDEFCTRHGARSALARALGLSPAAVLQWNGRVPAKRVVEVERLTGIPREALRPDLYRTRPELDVTGMPTT